MSAPPSGSASGSPSAGYYPDPSIPGYVRYWNGAAWVPGTSRPAPREGEPLPAPPSPAASQAAPPPTAAEPAPAEETGPVFLDEDAGPESSAGQEPSTAWQANSARQDGFAGQREDRISWGSHGEEGPGAEDTGGRVPEGGTFQMRALSPQQLKRQQEQGSQAQAAVPDHTVGLRRSDVLNSRAAQQGPPAAGVPEQAAQPPQHQAQQAQHQQAPQQQQQPVQQQPPAQQAPPQQQSQPQQQQPPQAPPQQQQAPQPQQQQAAPQQQHWAQQVHDLAAQSGGAPLGANSPAASALPLQQQSPDRQQSPAAQQEPVVPWKPPADDPFARMTQDQARPAGLGKRFAARLVDAVLTGAVAAAVIVPFLGQATAHIQEKIDAVRMSGRTERVWLIDGTTGGYLAIVLGVLIVFGLLYEVLPTSRWGHTLGKKLFGLKVLDVERQDTPEFGAALRRWLVYGVLGAVAVGVVNVVWCVFDRPWRQCWHDKAARTFVSKDSGDVRI